MKFKKNWSLAYSLYYMFALTFIGMCAIVGYSIYLKSSYFGKTDFLITEIPINVLVNDLDETLATFDHEDLSIRVKNNRTADLRIFGDPRKHLGSYLYYQFVFLVEKIASLLALFWGTRLFRNLAKGKHFDPKNTSYLFLIGWTLFLTSLFYITLNFLPLPLIDSIPLRNEGMAVFKAFPQDFRMAAGIISIVFGYVFKEGSRIYEEQKLTV